MLAPLIVRHAPLARRAAAVALALAVLFELARFPLAAPSLTIALLVYACALAWRHRLWLLVLPVLLPVLDLAPWSGRMFIDEFDLFVLTTVALWHWQQARQITPVRNHSRAPRIARLAFTALLASYAAATVMAWLQPSFFGAGAGCHLYNFCGSLRTLKGFIWALLLLAPLRAALSETKSGYLLLAGGMLLGLFGESIAIVIERVLFTGLWNFDAPFRATGSFSSLHTGGQHIDAYLAASIPFAFILLAAKSRSTTLNAIVVLTGLALFTLAAYAVLATFSRGLMVAAILSAGMLAVGATRTSSQSRNISGRMLVTVAALLVVFGLSLGQAMNSQFFSHRFAIVSQDMALRAAHWKNVLSLMSPDALQQLLGSGLASYPPTYARANHERNRPGSFARRTDNGNGSIRLIGGNPVYFEQRVDVAPYTRYRLSIDLAAAPRGSSVLAVLCEKSLRYSIRCTGTQLRPPVPGSGPQRVIRMLDSGHVGDARGETLGALARRPVTLALFAPRAADSVDLDNVELIAPDGTNLIRNGDFSARTDHWFFTADDADPWHIANLWLHLYFEQGLLGAAAFTLLIGVALWRAFRGAFAGNIHALMLFASLSGFVLIGTLGSLLDAPRLILLVHWLIAAALLLPQPCSAFTSRTAAST